VYARRRPSGDHADLAQQDKSTPRASTNGVPPVDRTSSSALPSPVTIAIHFPFGDHAGMPETFFAIVVAWRLRRTTRLQPPTPETRDHRNATARPSGERLGERMSVLPSFGVVTNRGSPPVRAIVQIVEPIT
jgi:hypothetical protein